MTSWPQPGVNTKVSLPMSVASDGQGAVGAIAEQAIVAAAADDAVAPARADDGVDDPRPPSRTSLPSAAIDRVGRGAAGDVVVAGIAKKRVDAVASGDGVLIGAAFDPVVVDVAEQRVVAGVAEDAIDAKAAADGVVAAAAVEMSLPFSP